MKFTRRALGNIVCKTLYSAIDEGIGNVEPEMQAIEEAEFAIYIERCLAERKKRIQFDISYTDTEDS